MSDPSDEKIELLVRSVLAAVDARLVGVRSEIEAVATDAARRHRDVLTHIHALERRWESRILDGGQTTLDGDSLATRMEQATQVLLERVEALNQRNTIATNERFALINKALEDLNNGPLNPAEIPVPMASLDGMNAPLRVGPSLGPVATPLLVSEAASMPGDVQEPAVVLPPPNSPAITAPVHAKSDDLPETIDMGRLADLLSERLGSLNLAAPMTVELSLPN